MKIKSIEKSASALLDKNIDKLILLSKSKKAATNSLTKKASNEYISEVNVSIYVNATPERKQLIYDYESNYKTSVKFTINIEARDWGIKDINLFVTNIAPIQLEIQYGEDGEDKKQIPVVIDALRIEKEKSENASSITVGDIELFVDENGQVDYNQSSMTIHCI